MFQRKTLGTPWENPGKTMEMVVEWDFMLIWNGILLDVAAGKRLQKRTGKVHYAINGYKATISIAI